MGSVEDQYQAAAEVIAARNVELRSFLLRLVDQEDLASSVTEEVRREVARLLNLEDKQ